MKTNAAKFFLLFILTSSNFSFAEIYFDKNKNLHLKHTESSNHVIFERSGDIIVNGKLIENCSHRDRKMINFSKGVLSCNYGIKSVSFDGYIFQTNSEIVSIHADGQVEQIRVDDATSLEADLNDLELKLSEYDKIKKDLRIVKKNTDLILDLSTDTLFEFDSADLNDESVRTLENLSEVIRKELKGYLLVAGHTDSVGSDSYNYDLSLKRAKSVARWLTDNEVVSESDLIIKGFGESQPVAANTKPDGQDNEAGRAKNRRVNLTIQTVRKDPSYLTSSVISSGSGSVVINNGRKKVQIGSDGSNAAVIKGNGKSVSIGSSGRNELILDDGEERVNVTRSTDESLRRADDAIGTANDSLAAAQEALDRAFGR